MCGYLSKAGGYRFFATIIVLALPALPFISRAAQTPRAGPSFSCQKAPTSAEKLICSDRDLSALDLEYSRLYDKRVHESGDKAEINGIKSNAKFFLQNRERCVNDTVNDALIKSYEVACLASWYHDRIADLSDLPDPAPDEWTPKLIDGAFTYSDRNRGLQRTRAQKPVPDIYFKAPGVERLFKMRGGEGIPWPARIDLSVEYFVYQKVLGSLTYVVENRDDGRLQFRYFFNRDGRLAAQERIFRRKTGAGVTDFYAETETVFYSARGAETRRLQPWLPGVKITTQQKDLSPARLERPPFRSFAAFEEARFKDVVRLDADRLGLCYLDLDDGYGSTAFVVNFDSIPLDVYEHFVPPINYRGMDFGGDQPSDMPGTIEPMGTLSGKRVYAVNYPSLVLIVVEREPDRYLPVLYSGRPGDQVGIKAIDGQDILFYTSRVSGNGGLTQEWYFLLDNGIPKEIDYRDAVGEELKKVLPPRCEAWRGGNLNLSTLTYSAYFRGDCPDGNVAEFTARLGFENGHFVVKSSSW
jgi:uncharacterized protein